MQWLNEASKKSKEHKYNDKWPVDIAINKYGVDNFAFDIIEKCSIDKLDNKEKQKEIIKNIINNKLTVRQTNDLIKKIIGKEKKEKEQNVKTVFKDLRVFTNSLNKTIKEMKNAGLEVEVDKTKSEKFIEYKIKLPREKRWNSWL